MKHLYPTSPCKSNRQIIICIMVLASVVFSANCFSQKPDSLTRWQPHHAKTQAIAVTQQAQTQAQPVFTHKVITAPGGKFGYDIYNNGRLMIHQPSMPGVRGNSGFKNRENADKVARLVEDKLKKGVLPPIVSISEMKTLNAL